jgi:hypothetical protein
VSKALRVPKGRKAFREPKVLRVLKDHKVFREHK